MTKTSIILSLLSYSMVLIFVTGSYHQLQYATGITNSTSTICINGKCITTMCIDNEPCRTLTSNSTTTAILDNSSKNKGNNTLTYPAPLRTA
ncbi:MAG TPA: hypothetical protein VKA95_15375 [Nitrososphaeraceae archaeon]|nr:hypothetical protein [Nitrososphaeraceae archaeon]